VSWTRQDDVAAEGEAGDLCLRGVQRDEDRGGGGAGHQGRDAEADDRALGADVEEATEA
jgi:hypothetical protein